ncbi:hypothetical protein ACJX0J_013729, partial [Zea mays]
FFKLGTNFAKAKREIKTIKDIDDKIFYNKYQTQYSTWAHMPLLVSTSLQNVLELLNIKNGPSQSLWSDKHTVFIVVIWTNAVLLLCSAYVGFYFEIEEVAIFA